MWWWWWDVGREINEIFGMGIGLVLAAYTRRCFLGFSTSQSRSFSHDQEQDHDIHGMKANEMKPIVLC